MFKLLIRMLKNRKKIIKAKITQQIKNKKNKNYGEIFKKKI